MFAIFVGQCLGVRTKGSLSPQVHSLPRLAERHRVTGVPPIELIDGEKLVETAEHLELGLNPIKTYEINETFFDEFKA